MNELWVIGDNFVAATYCEKFLNKDAKNGWFMKSNYEVFNYCNSRYSSSNQNILSRIQITVAAAINEKVKLPQVILMMLHNDLVKALDIAEPTCCATAFGIWIEWLIQQVNKLIEDRLANLPKKAIREKESIVYWLQIPQHKEWSFSRRAIHAKYNNVLDSVVKLYPRMRTIKFKESWDANDITLLSGTSIFGLSDRGLSQYWMAADLSVQYNFAKRREFLAKEHLQLTKQFEDFGEKSQEACRDRQADPMLQFFAKKKAEHFHDKFHWFKRNQRREDTRRVMGGNRFLLPRTR